MANLQPGQTLGPYRIIEQAGRGGMATVYKAYHAVMDRYVAVKILSPDMAQDELLKGRFQQEARLIANLEHAHILPVHDFGEQDGIYYIVMRFLDTGTLQDRIRQGPLTVNEIDPIITQLADALGYAHEQGVLHRDIKPSNVLLDARGDLYLTDFGIAKIVEGTTAFTATGAITGTPAYMSPEQAQGETLDPRTDIYSLGIVLYEMVTGRVPFEAETPLAVILQHLQAPLPLPSQIKPDIHPEVERLLLKALAKDRGDRFATCQEFQNAWKQALAAATQSPPGKELPQPKVEKPERPTVIETPVPNAATVVETAAGVTPAKRRSLPKWFWLGGGAALVLILVAVTALIWTRANQPEAVPTTAGSDQLLTNQDDKLPPPEEITTQAVFTSWVGGNTIYRVYSANDKIYTSGTGGITVWDPSDGHILQRITTADGLPYTIVSALSIQEEASVIWAATEEGLVRIEGQAWSHYSDQDGLDSDFISTITHLADGRMLAGTQYSDIQGGGLNILDGSRWQSLPGFLSVHPDDASGEQLSNAVTATLEVGSTLWVGTTHGLGGYDGSSWRYFFTSSGLPSDVILSLFSDHTGQLIVGTEAGAAVFNGDRFEPFAQSPPDGVYGIVESPENVLWFSGGGGIWRYDSSNQDWQIYSEADGTLRGYATYGGTADSEGNIYFGSDGEGLIAFRQGKTIEFWVEPNVPQGNGHSAILQAKDGTLWFPTGDATDVDLFKPQTGQWENPPEDLPGFPIYIDPSGRLWLNEWPSGFWILEDDGSATHITEPQGLPEEAFVNSAIEINGTAWLGTSLGLAQFNGTEISAFTSGKEIGLQGDEIARVFTSSDNALWVIGYTDFARRDPSGTWEVFGKGNPLREEWTEVYDIDQDLQGDIWVASAEGVYRLTREGWVQYSYGDPNVKLPSTTVYCVTGAADGSVWFGTDHGAARFDGQSWLAFQAGADGLASGRVYDIYAADTGEVFFATAGGVTRLQP